MSDGITVTPGTGRTVHADVVTLNGTTGLVQIVKILDATDASTNKLSISAAGAAKVEGTVATTQSGAWSSTVTQSTAASLNAQVVGSVAHDGSSPGNPVMTGGRARTTLSGVTVVSSHDAVYHVHDLDGVNVTRAQVPLGNLLSERVSATTSVATAFSTFTATTLLRNYITSIVATNNGATYIQIDLRNGTGGSVLMTVPVPTKGGAMLPLNPPLRQTSTNTALAYDANVALGGGYTITLIGFQSKL